MKTPVNGNTIRQHLAYSWWKYVLFTLLAIFSVSLYYSVTTYRSPADKVVDLYVYGFADEPALKSLLDDIREEEMSDMEKMDHLLLTTDDTYGAMQLTTYIAAGEGDVYILPHDNFVNLASQGTFVSLEEDEALIAIFNEAGVSLQNGWRRNTETGETHLYGIPLSKLPGFEKYVWANNGFISVLIHGGNTDNSMKLLRILSERMITAPEPEETATSENPEIPSSSDISAP